jgi:hypothetical protein
MKMRLVTAIDLAADFRFLSIAFDPNRAQVMSYKPERGE